VTARTGDYNREDSMNHIRRHKVRIIAAATTIGVVAAVAAAQFLQDATGGSSGYIKELNAITFQAGPVPNDKPVVPGGAAFGDASVTVNVPETIAGLEVYEVHDPGGPFAIDGVGDVAPGPLTVNARALSTPINVPDGPGDHNVRIPDTFVAAGDVPAEWRGHSFSKRIRLRFRAH
jgi:hypothetical protein